MIIKYEDITLRAIERKDLDLLREMMNDPAIENMTCGAPFPVSEFQQEKWFESLSSRSNELRLVMDVEGQGAVGVFALSDIDYKNGTAELHSKIATSKDLRGKGYGTKAVTAIIDYAFDQLNLNCIYSQIIEYNIASQRVKEKIGFVKEGILRERVYKNGKYHNVTVWSITKNDRAKAKENGNKPL